jgi:cobalt-zinc-cadmium efflux system outer membrane protein
MQDATKQSHRRVMKLPARLIPRVFFAGVALPCFALLMLTMATGCAAYTPAERFPDVQQSITERLGRRIVWDRGGAAGEVVRGEVAALLAQPLTADAAVQVALLNNSGLQATFEDLGVAQADLVQAGLLRNPDLAGFLRFPNGPPRGTNWNIGVDFWPMDAFLVPVRKKLAGAALDAAELRVTGVVLRLAADTRAAYYALQAEQQVLEARRSLAELAQIASDFSRRQYQAGNIDDLNLAQRQATFQQASITLFRAESADRVARERLLRLMGLSGSPSTWSIAPEALPSAAGEPAEEELVRIALASRSDVSAAAKDVQRLEYALSLTRKWWLQSIRVGVETERGSGGGYQTGPHGAFEIPIFDQRQAEVARQEALIRQARRRLIDSEEQAREEVRTALHRMRTAGRIDEYYRMEVVPLRKRTTGMLEKRYQGMLLGVFDLLTAKTEEVNAVSAAALARQDYWTARSDLELALGRRLPPPGPITTRPTTTPAPGERSESPATRPVRSMPDMPGMPKPGAR